MPRTDQVMPPLQPLVPKGDAGYDLLEILSPYLWLDEVTPVRLYHAPCDPHLMWLEVRGIVKFQGKPVQQAEPADQDEAYTRAHAVRTSLTATAETAIIAAEDAGYLHERHPEITVEGDLRHGYPPRSGQPDTLIAKVSLRMWLTRSEWDRRCTR